MHDRMTLLVERVAGVTADPMYRNVSLIHQDVKLMPEVLILYRRLRAGSPAVAHPPFQPVIDPLLHISGIGKYLDGRILETRIRHYGCERFDYCGQLHSIIGRTGICTRALEPRIQTGYDIRPRARTRISDTSAVGIDLKLFCSAHTAIFDPLLPLISIDQNSAENCCCS